MARYYVRQDWHSSVIVRSVSRITAHDRGNGRRPNMVGVDNGVINPLELIDFWC